MSDEKIYGILVRLKDNPDLRSWKNSYPEEYALIVEATPFLPSKCNIRQRIWHLTNNVLEPVMCMHCESNPRPWNDSKHEYRMFCSNACNHAHGGLRVKQKATNIERYGVENIRQDVEFMKSKRKDKTGHEFPSQDPLSINKLITNNLNKYGVKWNITSESSKQKKQQTIEDRYGVKHYMSSFDVWKKVAGLSNLTEEYLRQVWDKLNDRQFLINEHHIKMKTLTTISKELGVSQSTVGLFYKRLDVEVIKHSTSTAEIELREYLQSLGLCVISNTRSIITPLELDIFIPSHNLAIEYNGLFYHGELSGKSPNYHLNKTKLCNDKGITLIHIREDEWYHNQDIVKSRLCSKLGIYSRRLYGRNSVVRVINHETVEFFLEHNHIQGWCSSTVNLGLYCNEELVSVMTFGKSRFNNGYQYELLRFCSLLNTTVIGGAGKLFQYFIQNYNPESVISYCNLSWNNGKVYKSIGFDNMGSSPPSPSYFKVNGGVRTINRIHLQKHKLKDILPIYDPEKTGWENLILNGYDRYWDCGNSVWGWKK